MIASFSSCHDCVCASSDGLKVSFISFDSTEIDTIIARKFQKGSNFTQLIDSLQWDKTNLSLNKHNDSFQMGSWIGKILLQSQYDYQLFMPANNRIFKIAEISEPQCIDDCSGKVMCINLIVSAKLNDTTRSVQNEILYLKK
jgi:hypothetical protein